MREIKLSEGKWKSPMIWIIVTAVKKTNCYSPRKPVAERFFPIAMMSWDVKSVRSTSPADRSTTDLTSQIVNGRVENYRYDAAGNLLQDAKNTYEYDAFRRTSKVTTKAGDVQINRYDAEGLRCEMEENGKLVQFIFNENKASPEAHHHDRKGCHPS